MVPFLVDTLVEIAREFCIEFILDEVMERSTSTTKEIKLNNVSLITDNVFNKNLQKVNVDLGFALPLFFPMFPFDPPENIRKPKVF